MPAARKTRQPGRRSATLLASLLLAASCAWGQALPLGERLAEIREINRFIPERALPMLLAIEREARAASVEDKGEMLAQLCVAQMGVGQLDKALATCEELIEFGRQANDNGALAKGLLRKGYIKYKQKELALSHALIWEAERLAETTNDVELRVRAGVSSSESFSEDGNFPRALEKAQATLAYTRQHGDAGPPRHRPQFAGAPVWPDARVRQGFRGARGSHRGRAKNQFARPHGHAQSHRVRPCGRYQPAAARAEGAVAWRSNCSARSARSRWSCVRW